MYALQALSRTTQVVTLSAGLIVGCSPVTETARFVNRPGPGTCTTNYVRTGPIWRPAQLITTCADMEGKYIYLQAGSNGFDLLQQIGGPLGGVANRVFIPLPTN